MERPRPSRPSRGGGARSAGSARGSAPVGVSAPLRGGGFPILFDFVVWIRRSISGC